MDVSAALSEYFGFPAFRRGQREAVEAAVAGRDVLVVMPTGSGKSLCYQLPALLREDLTIVVSPLVALMQDQVDALRARGLGDRVALVNAQQDGATNADALARAVGGDVRLLYVAPERFSSPGFVERIGQARIGLFVVDEAHCVSQWGHDFRPDYFRLADAARHLGADAIVASTATATPQVASDIVRRLSLREPVRVATGFDRPNLAFAVARPAPHEKRPLIAELLRGEDALPAIVYAGTRAGSEELRDHLRAELGVAVEMYHAGLERADRADVQRRFLADEVQVIVATNAFGMGVDKPNVRTVVHASVPASLEAYYQEAGRAGRDGAPARALLLAENRDKALHVHFIKRDEVDEQLPARLAARLAAGAHDGSLPGMGPARYDVDAVDLGRAVDVERRAAAVADRAPVAGGGDRAVALVARPGGGPDRGAVRRPRNGALPRVGGRGVEGALAPVPRHLGVRRERRLPPPVDPAPLRRPLRPGAARRLLRRVWRRPRAGAAAARAGGHREPRRRDRVGGARVRSRRSAAPPAPRSSTARAPRRSSATPTTACPRTAPPANMRRADILARIDELIEEKRLQTTGGPYPVLLAPPAPVAA